MGLRFRRRVKIFPGCHLNISKSGVSTSFGVRGASVTVGQRGTHANLGIPGTGLSYREKIGSNQKQKDEENNDSTLDMFNPSEIKSLPPSEISSKHLQEFAKLLQEARKRYRRSKKIRSINIVLSVVSALSIVFLPLALIFGVLAYLSHKRMKTAKVDLSAEVTQDFSHAYKGILNAFRDISEAQYIWDITSEATVDKKTRSAANKGLTREKIKITFGIPNYIYFEEDLIHLDNANGADLYLAPGFIIFDGKSNKEFGIIDFKDIQVKIRESKFIEEDKVPKDSIQVGETWEKVNKSGERDKRFANNRLLPILLYPEFTFLTDKGLYESYMVSNTEKGQKLLKELNNYFSL